MNSRAAVAVLLIPLSAAASAENRSRNWSLLAWNEALLGSVSAARTPPMITARALAIMHTCMYDAWAAYDATADGVHWDQSPRRPAEERIEANKAEAISFAAHAALVDLFPGRSDEFDRILTAQGYSSPGPAGVVGRTACDAVLRFRYHDGANQLGDLHPGPYSDYTRYTPVNGPEVINDPNHWQPLVTATGPQQFIAPHWGLVIPFAIRDLAALRPPSPPQYAHGEYRKEANGVLHLSARLDDTSKMIAEYWADGPGSVTPPGHWMLFAQMVSRRDGHSLDDDVKLFFALSNALLDASIAVWDCKRAFDSARPVTAIRFLYAGRPVRAWAGPGLGVRLIDGAQFRSYIGTPAFPEYVSGHSTFSAASAEILRLFTGSDALGAWVTFTAGSSTIEPGLTPAHPVTLSWPTFSDAADEAGMSRRYGGIHFERGDLAGRRLGRAVAQLVWQKVGTLVNGTVIPLSASALTRVSPTR